MATARDDGRGGQRQPGSRSPGFIPRHCGYEGLLTFRKARMIYDGTVRFCGCFVDIRNRTHDQMLQAARSGKQNILEGYPFTERCTFRGQFWRRHPEGAGHTGLRVLRV